MYLNLTLTSDAGGKRKITVIDKHKQLVVQLATDTCRLPPFNLANQQPKYSNCLDFVILQFPVINLNINIHYSLIFSFMNTVCCTRNACLSAIKREERYSANSCWISIDILITNNCSFRCVMFRTILPCKSIFHLFILERINTRYVNEQVFAGVGRLWVSIGGCGPLMFPVCRH